MFMIIPRKLGRLGYIGYLLGLIVVTGILVAIVLPEIPSNGDDSASNLLLVLSLILGSLKIFLMDIPRLRSIGWSPWVVLIMLVPFLNGIMQILLLVLPQESYTSGSDSLLKEIQDNVRDKRNR